MNKIRLHPFGMVFLLAVSGWLMTGCAGMGSGYESPTVSVQSFRTLPSSDGSGLPKFEIGLHVINPYLEALDLDGVSYTISLNGRELIKGVGNELPVIEGYGEGTFTLTAGFNLMAGIQLFRSLAAEDSDGLDYRFEAKLDPGALRRKIRVTHSGELSFNQ